MGTSTQHSRHFSPAVIPAGLEYQQVVAATRPAWWRGVLAIVLILIGLFGIGIIMQTIGAIVNDALGLLKAGEVGFTPISHLSGLVGVALLIPWSMLVQRWVYGVSMRSLFSVVGRLRMDVIGRALLILAPIYAVLLIFVTLDRATGTWSRVDLLLMVAITIVVAPLQSAAEEFGFRGVVFRAAASWGRGPVMRLIIGIVVSAIAFAAVHGAGDPWLIQYYLALGVSWAVITWRTGGLEVSIVAHAVNNTIAFIYLIALHDDFGASFDRSVGSTGPVMLLPTVVTLSVGAVVYVITGRRGPAVTRSADEAIDAGRS